MPNFEKRENYSRETYDKTEEDEASLKAQSAGAKSAKSLDADLEKLKGR